MLNTLPDIILNGEEYENIYSLIGIPVGTALIIQNKSIWDIQVVKKATQPPLNTKGYIVAADPRFTLEISSGENGCWVLGKGPIKVVLNERLLLRPLASALTMKLWG